MSDFDIHKIPNGYLLNKYIGAGGTAVIPDNVTYVAHDAFHNCTSLTCIVLPDRPLHIDSSYFNGCTSLTEIKASENNPSYISEDGVLFAISKHLLMKYPAGSPRTEYVIPEGVTCIRALAFQHCNALKSVVLPDSLTKIETGAFRFCSSLEKIQFPEHSIAIESDVFSGTPWLENYPDDFVIVGDCLVKYKGNQKEITLPDNVSHVVREGISSEINVCYHGVKFPSKCTWGHHKLEHIRKLIDTKDFSLMTYSFLKEDILLAMFLANPEDEIVCSQMKFRLSEIFSHFVEYPNQSAFQNDEVEILQKILDSGKFITKDNIDEFIQYMINYSEYELQTMLMDYKYKHIEFSDPSDKLKLD